MFTFPLFPSDMIKHPAERFRVCEQLKVSVG